MLVFRFGPSDLANVRFAISPLSELQSSVRALDDPGSQAIHLPWIAATRQSTRDLDLDLLRALQPRGVYSPDFIQPPPSSPLTELEDELAEMLATSADEVRAEVEFIYRRVGEPEILSPFLDEPDAAVARLAELIREYWRRALEPHWEKLRGLLRGDVLYRGRRLADGGARLLFADLHPEARFEQDELRIEKPWQATRTLDGRGLLLVPSAFNWPVISAITEPPWQPTLIYPARGCGLVWEPVGPPSEGLAALIGTRRAMILASLEGPCSTTWLSRRLEVGPGSISQHLAVLHDAGLIVRHRVGRVVLYRRSAAGNLLLEAA